MRSDRPLDQYDLAILNVVESDGRISVADLARRVGLSKSPVQTRLRRLEADGIIIGYRALIDPIRLGRDHVAFVEVKLTETREAALSAFNDAIRAIPEVETCHLIAGTFDYLLKVRTRDMTTYRDTLATRISTLPYVSHTSTYVSMQEIKDGS